MRLDETSSSASRIKQKLLRSPKNRVASIDLSKELGVIPSFRPSQVSTDASSAKMLEEPRDSLQSITSGVSDRSSRARSVNLSKTFPATYRDSAPSEAESAIYPTPRTSDLTTANQATATSASASASSSLSSTREIEGLNSQELSAALEALGPGISTSMMDRLGRAAIGKRRTSRKLS
jgi:hypothetical protein